MSEVMDVNHHGLLNPERAFFKNLKFWAWADKLG